jgi:hypothetical protein
MFKIVSYEEQGCKYGHFLLEMGITGNKGKKKIDKTEYPTDFKVSLMKKKSMSSRLSHKNSNSCFRCLLRNAEGDKVLTHKFAGLHQK